MALEESKKEGPGSAKLPKKKKEVRLPWNLTALVTQLLHLLKYALETALSVSVFFTLLMPDWKECVWLVICAVHAEQNLIIISVNFCFFHPFSQLPKLFFLSSFFICSHSHL